VASRFCSDDVWRAVNIHRRVRGPAAAPDRVLVVRRRASSGNFGTARSASISSCTTRTGARHFHFISCWAGADAAGTMLYGARAANGARRRWIVDLRRAGAGAPSAPPGGWQGAAPLAVQDAAWLGFTQIGTLAAALCSALPLRSACLLRLPRASLSSGVPDAPRRRDARVRRGSRLAYAATDGFGLPLSRHGGCTRASFYARSEPRARPCRRRPNVLAEMWPSAAGRFHQLPDVPYGTGPGVRAAAAAPAMEIAAGDVRLVCSSIPHVMTRPGARLPRAPQSRFAGLGPGKPARAGELQSRLARSRGGDPGRPRWIRTQRRSARSDWIADSSPSST
jgi:hypothetical protein